MAANQTNAVEEDDVMEPLQRNPRKQRRVAAAPVSQQVAARHAQNWPAWGYLVIAAIALVVWLGGTAAQVQISESWIAQTNVTDVLAPHFSIYAQLTMFWNGDLIKGTWLPTFSVGLFRPR